MRRGVCPAVYILLMFTSAIIELGEDFALGTNNTDYNLTFT